MKWTVTILKRQPPSMWFCNRAFINIYFFPSGVTSQSGILRRKWIKCFYQGSNYISGINLHQILMQIACYNFEQNFLFKLSQNVTNDSLVNNVQKDMVLEPYPYGIDLCGTIIRRSLCRTLMFSLSHDKSNCRSISIFNRNRYVKHFWFCSGTFEF